MYKVDTYFNKRNILNRMKKLVLSNGRQKNTSELDPFVSLFLASLSEEIYKIAGEVEKMESRILDKICDMLVSDIFLHPVPSHAIMHMTPIEPTCQITKSASFIYKKDKEITFHPVCNTKIVKGDIRYMIINGLCYSIDNDQTKTLLSRSRTDNEHATFWIGLELDDSIENLKGLSFYLNFSDIDRKEDCQKLLPYFNWKFKSQPFTLKHGLLIEEDEPESRVIELFNALDFNTQIDKFVLSKYEGSYFTITEDIFISKADKFCLPKKIVSQFSNQFVNSCTQPLIWIEVEYPLTINKEILPSLQVSINTFPIINRLLKSTIINLDRINSVIPIETEEGEHFQSIKSVVDETGRKYHELPFADDNGETYKTYSLRRGGYEKYNSRDAREYLVTIYNLLDKYSVSLNGDDAQEDDELREIQSYLSELIKYIRHTIGKKIEKSEPKMYLQIDNADNEKILFIKYWITNTEKANNIKPGIVLNNNSGQPVIPSSLVLLTTTSGGKSSPLSDDRQNIFHKALGKSFLIITNEDISRFCKEEFGTALESVSIKKGLMADPHYTERFIQTTDIHLTMDKNIAGLLKERDRDIFLQKIEKKSPANYNYRVFIN